MIYFKLKVTKITPKYQKMTLLYLHGFNADGNGWKSKAMMKHFPDAQVYSPDLPARPVEVVALLLEWLATAQGPIGLFGSSLGGFYAYYLSACQGHRAFLFNPSLKPHLTLHRGIGSWETHLKKRPYVFEASYLEELAVLKQEAEAKTAPERLFFFLAKDDNILDHSDIPALFPKAGHIAWYEPCGHQFDPFERALKEIKQAGWLSI